MTFVMVAGEIDLSVGSIFGASMVTMALSLRDGAPVWLAILFALAVATTCGLFNGVLSVVFNVPTIIITLGTLSVFRGIIWSVTDAFPVEDFSKESSFFELGLGKIGGLVPYQFVVLVAVAAVGIVVLQFTAFGRHVYATGSNRRAASYSGIHVNRVKILVLTIMGFCAGVAGIMGFATTQSGDVNGGSGYELDVIAATIVGGTKLGGGAGTILGSVIGVFIISGVVRNGLVLVGVSIYTQVIVSGAIVIAAVALDHLVKRRTSEVRELA
jgi:ribose transport system permease protein